MNRKISADSIEYRIETNHNDPLGDDMPVFAIYTVSKALARQIVEWADYIRAQGLHRVEKYDGEVDYYLDDEFEIEDRGESANDSLKIVDTVLVVNGDSFWYESHVESFGSDVSTDKQSVDELAADCGIQRAASFGNGTSPSHR